MNSLNSLSPLNPFGFNFAERMLSDDHFDYIKYKREKDVYRLHCLPHTLTHSIAPHYTCVHFKIVKKERKGCWTEETISYEKHYISLSYFSVWMGLSVDQYIDIQRSSCDGNLWAFKRDTNAHPVNKPIILAANEKVSYDISVEGICFCNRRCRHLSTSSTSTDISDMNDEYKYDWQMAAAEPICVQEFDPMQWY
jgi:hypothetical protein